MRFIFVENTKFTGTNYNGNNYCSDFRYESNGIFVLGVGFFSADKFRLFNKPSLTEFFNIIQKVLLSWA